MITWKEFKNAAKAAGVRDKDEIFYIDFYAVDDISDISFDTKASNLTKDSPQPPAIRGWRIW